MIVVSDTSPISNLMQIGRTELLVDLFGRVIIPPTVARELHAEHNA
jgi:predicted nucleic acid-binding protein